MRLPQRPKRARSPARLPAISCPPGSAFSRLAHSRVAAQAAALLQSARPDRPERRLPGRSAQIPAGFRRAGCCSPLKQSVPALLSVEARLPPPLRPLAHLPECPRARRRSPLWRRSQPVAEASRTVDSLRSALALLLASRKPRTIGFAPPGRHLHIALYRHLDHRRIEAGRLLQAYHSNCKTARDQVAPPGNGCIDASDSFPLM